MATPCIFLIVSDFFLLHKIIRHETRYRENKTYILILHVAQTRIYSSKRTQVRLQTKTGQVVPRRMLVTKGTSVLRQKQHRVNWPLCLQLPGWLPIEDSCGFYERHHILIEKKYIKDTKLTKAFPLILPHYTSCNCASYPGTPYFNRNRKSDHTLSNNIYRYVQKKNINKHW